MSRSFSSKCVGQVNTAVTILEVSLVELSHSLDLLPQPVEHKLGHHHNSVFVPFGLADRNLRMQKQQGAEDLILRAGADLSSDGQVAEESFDFRRAHFGGMLLVMAENASSNPLHVGFLSANRVMQQTAPVTRAIEEPSGRIGIRVCVLVRIRVLVRSSC
jgi:hypothetical protein